MQLPAMDQNALTTFVQFNNWANQHLLAVAQRLEESALHEPSPYFDLGTAFASITHLYSVEWSWQRAARLQDLAIHIEDVEQLPDLASMRAFAARFGAQLESYVAGLSAAELAEAVDIGTPRGRSPEWVRRENILIHLINHGTAHRVELAHFLTSKGHSPGDIDYLDFVMGRSQ